MNRPAGLALLATFALSSVVRLALPAAHAAERRDGDRRCCLGRLLSGACRETELSRDRAPADPGPCATCDALDAASPLDDPAATTVDASPAAVPVTLPPQSPTFPSLLSPATAPRGPPA